VPIDQQNAAAAAVVVVVVVAAAAATVVVVVAPAAFFNVEVHKQLNCSQIVSRNIVTVLGFTSHFTICHFLLDTIHQSKPMSFSCSM
jgi:hypothetical protein